MKKKAIFLLGGSVLAIATVALSCLFVSKFNSSFKQVAGADVDYTLTIDCKDFTTSTSYTSGSKAFVTDATKDKPVDQQNKVTFEFEQGALIDTDYICLQQYGVGMIYNPKTSAISSIKSLKYTIIGDAFVEWGWLNPDTNNIDFNDVRRISSGTNTFEFNNEYPNFVRISSTDDSAPYIKTLVFTYDKSCEASAYPFVSNGTLDFRINSMAGEAKVLGWNNDYTGSKANLEIPDTYAGCDVIEIEESAFANDNDIHHVTLPNNLKVVGTFAFDGCSNIEELEIPNTVHDIRGQAFRDLTSCHSLTFEEGADCLLSVGVAAFQNIGHQGVLTLPSRISAFSTDGYTFSGATNITAFDFNDDNVSGNNATIVDGVLFWELWGTKYLVSYPDAKTATSYTIPNDVKSISSSDGLGEASHLEELVVAPASGITTVFNSYSAEYLTNLETLTLGGDGTIRFNHYCLIGASKLKAINIPDNVVVGSNGLAGINSDTSDPLHIYLHGSDIPGTWNSGWDGGDVSSNLIVVHYNASF